jgi:division protein CdvB (Snf7/Vps24/ESCRT-III family)
MTLLNQMIPQRKVWSRIQGVRKGRFKEVQMTEMTSLPSSANTL